MAVLHFILVTIRQSFLSLIKVPIVVKDRHRSLSKDVQEAWLYEATNQSRQTIQDIE